MKALRPRKTPRPQTEYPIRRYVTDLLENIEGGKTVLRLRERRESLFSRRSGRCHLFHSDRKIKITVVSAAGKEAVLAMLGPHGFFGEGCLVSQTLRVSTAKAMQPSTLFRIEKRAMIRALHDQPELSEKFMASLLARNIDLEEDLCDQLFNHSEKRLARVLLKLARLREHDAVPDAKMPRAESRDPGRNGGHDAVSHHTLHEQIQNNGPDRLQRRNHRESRIADRPGPARLIRESR